MSSALRNARERSGLDIGEIAARTKIRPAFLQALETGHFEVLPGHFFTRSFLRTYAQELGLSADEVVSAFDRAHGPARPAEPTVIEPQPERPREQAPRALRAMRQLPATWQIAAAAALVLIISLVANRPQRSDPPSPVAVGTSGSVAAAPAVAAPAPADKTAAPEKPAPDILTIQIHPAATVWVAARADGAPALYKLLQPGQQVTVTGRELSFRVGNAAAFVYSVNGSPGKPVGRPGEVREFSISTANYREYLR